MEDQGHDAEDGGFGRQDKNLENRRLVIEDNGMAGLFKVNSYQYWICARSWRPPLRYRVLDVTDKHEAILGENVEYADTALALRKSWELVNREFCRFGEDGIYQEPFVRKIKRLWEDCGQGCDAILQGRSA